MFGPLRFNIFVNDLIMFIEKTDNCNFMDDNTLYKSTISFIMFFETFRCLINLSFHHKWNDVRLLLINMGARRQQGTAQSLTLQLP